MRNLKYLFIFLFFLCINNAWAINISESLVPGGLAILPLGEIKINKNNVTTNRPKVTFQGRKSAIAVYDNHWYAMIGLPLKLKPNKIYYARVSQSGKKNNYLINVKNKKYPEQRITVKNQRMVVPNKLDMKRINSEKKIISKAKYYWDDQPLDYNFMRPIEGKLISKFGLKRFFNNQPRSPHSGIDVPAPTGTPINSIAKGKVLLTGEFYFNGKTVFISHGQGVVSFYCHMDEIDVQEGDLVTQHSIIGKVGSTGRSTGPHLHMSLYFNGVAVDPEIFLEYQEYQKEPK